VNTAEVFPNQQDTVSRHSDTAISRFEGSYNDNDDGDYEYGYDNNNQAEKIPIIVNPIQQYP
jgi:hypothetical protein